ncbi:retrotransposon protein, putative, ty1-copia subclass [Tanacetum coccineum]|uniref:Retrotransposon protein, putative, ty1-copia subclass n=1 Tax=Tanacetum coccineum TaxID=301880 RepID=A0ABQ4Z6L7_9ASTR
MLAISQFPIKVAESMAKMILKEAQWLWMAWIYSWKSLTKETQEEEAEDIDYNLELIQEEDTNPYLDTSLDHEEDDQELMNLKLNQVLILGPQGHAISPQIDCVYTFDAEEHEFLGDLEKPANYKAALLDPESKKWLDAMNVEMQSMKDNDVWVLIELPPNARTIGSKWLFKKKTDMDGAVYVFKAHIRAIRILIAIAAYYDYEIWQMDVKTALLLWTTFEEVYMEQPEVFVNPKYPNHVCKLKRSIYGLKTGTIPMQEKLKLSKSQGASTPAEKQRMQNVPYASAIGSINRASEQYSGGRWVLSLGRWRVGSRGDCGGRVGEAKWRQRNEYNCELFFDDKARYEDQNACEIEREEERVAGIFLGPYYSKMRSLKGARHFHAKVHYLRETIKMGDVKIEKIDINDNLAGPFTKALAFPKHSELTRNIGLLPASSFM